MFELNLMVLVLFALCNLTDVSIDLGYNLDSLKIQYITGKIGSQ